MSTQDQAPEFPDQVLPQVDELTALKARADLLNLSYHPSIGVEKLREKIAAALAGETPKEDATVETKEPTAPVEVYIAPVSATPAVVTVKHQSPKEYADEISEPAPNETVNQRNLRLKRHANALIRINVTCLNPAKKEWEGEIIGGGNSTVGSLTKFIPFGTTEGYHVPRILYNILRDRQCQIFVNAKDKNGKTVGRQGKLIKEFAIDVLNPLNEEELQDLAQRQAMSGAIG